MAFNFSGFGGRAPSIGPAPVGDSAPGEQLDDSLDMQDDENLDDQLDGDETQGDDDEDGENVEFFDLFDEEESTGDDDDDDGGDDNSPEAVRARQQAVATELQQMIGNMRLPDDAIPDDFDASDPRQLRGLMQRVMQQGAAQSMRIFLKPVEIAMRDSIGHMERRIRDEINSSQSANSESQVLRQIVPEADDPEIGSFVRQMYKQTAGKGKNGNVKSPSMRARAIRNFLDKSGMAKKPKAGSGGNKSNESSGNTGIMTGKAALDAFLPMPPAPKRPKR